MIGILVRTLGYLGVAYIAKVIVRVGVIARSHTAILAYVVGICVNMCRKRVTAGVAEVILRKLVRANAEYLLTNVALVVLVRIGAFAHNLRAGVTEVIVGVRILAG